MAKVRTKQPNREQGVMRFEMPDDALPANHKARLFWRVLGTLDLSCVLSKAKAVEGGPGRDVLCPRMMLTLWLYAIAENIGSAREIERRTESDVAFRWILGGCRVRRAALSAFRIEHRDAFDQLLTDVLATLLHRGLLSLDLVAQDGTRVRASASDKSFHQWASLLECREQAALHLKAVLAESDGDTSAGRARAAKARDYEQRVTAALDELEGVFAKRYYADIPRASSTDPDAKVMHMADGGFRAAYNVQLATAGGEYGGPRTIVGVRVTNSGSDQGSVEPMLADIERRTGKRPKVLLADADHSDNASIEAATARGVRPVISTSQRQNLEDKARTTKPDTPAIAAWKRDMETEEAKSLAKQRPGLAELTNAHAKTRFTMSSLLVRGLEKVFSVALLVALTSNILAHAHALAT